MVKSPRGLIAFVVCVCFSANVSLFGQTSSSRVPEPYRADEFPRWAKDSGRFVVISMGTLPFAVLLSTFGYGCYRYFANDMNSAYAPWPFSSSGAVSLSDGEQKTTLMIAAGVSVGAALFDFIMQCARRNEKKRVEEQSRRGEIYIAPLAPDGEESGAADSGGEGNSDEVGGVSDLASGLEKPLTLESLEGVSGAVILPNYSRMLASGYKSSVR